MRKRIPFPAALAGMLLFLAALGLASLICARGGAEKDVILARRDGWTVKAGAPEQRGAPVFVSREELLRGTLILVGPEHPLPEDYPAPSARAVRTMVGSYLPAEENVFLREEAIYALCLMQFDHPLAGGLTITRGAVSAAQQDEMRREAFQRYARVYPLEEALAMAKKAAPAGGESEHQTGLAVDIALSPPLSLGEKDPLRRNETGKWVESNLWRYGFLRRWGPGSGEESACESIHIRYVGTAHAAALHALDTDLEGYWALLRKEGALTLCRGDTPFAYLYCAPCEENLTFLLPEGREYRASADGEGYAAVVIGADERTFSIAALPPE